MGIVCIQQIVGKISRSHHFATEAAVSSTPLQSGLGLSTQYSRVTGPVSHDLALGEWRQAFELIEEKQCHKVIRRH